MTLSAIIGYTLVATAVGLKAYLLIDEEIKAHKQKRAQFKEDEKDRRFDFIFRNLQKCFNYKQVLNTEKLMDKYLLPSDKSDTRYSNVIKELRRIKFELANRKTNLDIIEPCKN